MKYPLFCPTCKWDAVTTKEEAEQEVTKVQCLNCGGKLRIKPVRRTR